MSERIQFEWKEQGQNRPDIIEEKKFTYDNANEIKQVVNDHADEIEASITEIDGLSAQIGGLASGVLPAELTTNPATNPTINAYFLVGGAGSYTNILTAASTPMTLSAPEAAQGLWMAYKGSDGYWDKIVVLVLPDNIVTTDNIIEKIVDAPLPFGENLATSFPNNGYIDASGNGIVYAGFKYTDWTPVPEGATKVKVAVAGDLTIAFRREDNSFIETLGVVGQQYDVEFDIPTDSAIWAYTSGTDFLPGGADYATHPAYVKFNSSEAIYIPWQTVSPTQIEGAVEVSGNANYGKYFPNTGYIDASGNVIAYAGFYHTDKIIIPSGVTKFKVAVAGDFSGAFYNSGGAFISSFGVSGQEYDVEFDIPVGAVSIRYTSSDEFIEGGINYDIHPSYLYFAPYTTAARIDTINPNNEWKGKRIAWYGTSIPAGYPKESNRSVWSYANKCVNQLGGIIQNYCVSNGLVREAKYNGSPVAGGRALLRFSVNTSTINYQNSMVNLIGTANEPDLFVFNYDVNDIDDDDTDFNLFDPLDPYNAAMPINSRNKNYFIGAMNFCIDALRTAKPKARICFITHFSEDSNATEQEYLACINVVTALARYWGAPVLNLAHKTQWVHKGSFNSIVIYNPDGIHPASLNTTESVDILAHYCKEFIENIK